MKGLTILVALSLLFIGCAEKKNKVESPAVRDTSNDVPVVDVPAGPFVPPGTGPGSGPGTFNGLDFDVGGTSAFEIEGNSIQQKNFLLSEYTGRPMNDPKNMSLNVNFIKIGENNWGGTITTAYTENGQLYYWYFSSGSSEEATKYNKWFEKDGKQVFHAVLEDFEVGAVVLVIDDALDLGDGPIEDSVSGSLWFKNYGITYAPHPPTHCWFVSFKGTDTGTPYDCRPWPTSDNYNNTYLSVYPTRQSSDPYKGYKKLGSFHNLSIKKAFNGDL
ncbi:MAG: hypothetical protein H6625_00230 [Bdellovibrionaceae bacterium]|nr:hypothetical protein [Pseudobdellovibrionaceae bacterium]